ncbi:MAG: 1,6-anhydro-N-acetylmuramyl-L-alanine amidase AmpD [Proteobacteria bacterium]|nr:1,6-anhydro-N-acetylmuramyl-L-alanine amidase AmpD [Pseudomonadota bacterium]MDA1331607.1 1,6-anhydro-N-acetylmuramyl-L-alanine amidase AmpD [Pseudomonadota bacterium]
MTDPRCRIEDGYLIDAERCYSPNYDDRPSNVRPSLIVIHSISLPPGEFGGADIRRLFTNQLDTNAHPFYQQLRGLKVSTHFLIDRVGCITQFVSCLHRAWHAGESRWRGELNCNNYSIGIELEGTETDDFELRQYVSLRKLCQSLVVSYPIEACVGHSHIALPMGRKKDPGVGFDWSELSSVKNIDLPK